MITILGENKKRLSKKMKKDIELHPEKYNFYYLLKNYTCGENIDWVIKYAKYIDFEYLITLGYFLKSSEIIKLLPFLGTKKLNSIVSGELIIESKEDLLCLLKHYNISDILDSLEFIGLYSGSNKKHTYITSDILEKYYNDLPRVTNPLPVNQKNNSNQCSSNSDIYFKINDGKICKITHCQLSEEFIEKHFDEIDPDELALFPCFNKERIKKIISKVSMNGFSSLCESYTFSEDEIVEYEQYFTDNKKAYWNIVFRYCKFSEDFFIKYAINAKYPVNILINNHKNEWIKKPSDKMSLYLELNKPNIPDDDFGFLDF